MMRGLLLLIMVLVVVVNNALAAPDCRVDYHQVEPGISEMVLGNIAVKIESNNNIIKMKIGEAFDTHNWTWASVEKGAATIQGIIRKQGREGVAAELIGIRTGTGALNWALFHCSNPFSEQSSGTAYFVIKGSLYCVETVTSEWRESVEKVLGTSFAEQSAVKAVSPDDAYSKMGLQ